LESFNYHIVDSTGSRFAYLDDGAIYLMPLDDLEDAAPRLVGRHDGAHVLAVGPGGQALASGDKSGEIRIWTPASGASGPRSVFEATSPIGFLTFDATASSLASTHEGGTVHIWDLEGPPGAVPLRLQGATDSVFQYGFDFHPSGDRLVSTHRVGGGVLWTLGHHYSRTLFRKENGDVYTRGIAFAPDGSRIAAAMGDRVVRRWPLTRTGGDPDRIEPTNRGVAHALAASPDGRYLLVGKELGVELVPLHRGIPRKLPGFEGSVAALTFSHDGRFAAAGGGFAKETLSDQFVRVWDLETDAFEDVDTDDEVTGIRFMPDGRVLFISGGDLYRWVRGDASAERLKEDVAGPHVHGGLYLTDDGRYLLTKKDRPLLHDLEEGGTREIPYSCSSVDLDHTGNVIICGGSDGSIRVIPVAGGAPHLLVGHEGEVNQVVIAPDGRSLASAGSDGRLRLWPMPEGEPLADLPREQFLDLLRAMTNERIVLDEAAPDGWRLELDPPHPGWLTVPTW
jgi:WD40 repeat protein